jgi:hypothetical protein
MAEAGADLDMVLFGGGIMVAMAEPWTRAFDMAMCVVVVFVVGMRS